MPFLETRIGVLRGSILARRLPLYSGAPRYTFLSIFSYGADPTYPNREPIFPPLFPQFFLFWLRVEARRRSLEQDARFPQCAVNLPPLIVKVTSFEICFFFFVPLVSTCPTFFEDFSLWNFVKWTSGSLFLSCSTSIFP